MSDLKSEKAVHDTDPEVLISQYKEDLVKAHHRINNLVENDKTMDVILKFADSMPSIAKDFAEHLLYTVKIKSDLDLCKRIAGSGAFGKTTAEEAYVKIKAGEEMGLSAIESMQTFCIIRGVLLPYGDKMASLLTRRGYVLEYLNESKESVTVRCSKGNEVYEETATSKDDFVNKSEAYKFAPKNKLRYHGIRMILSFRLPHLVSSVADLFSNDYAEWSEVQSNKEVSTDVTISFNGDNNSITDAQDNTAATNSKDKKDAPPF